MGFLDHSTNNIILDAVLTDAGRQFLARNDGSFSISKFALGDDEVNYGIIQKYGRTVGREKIEKNTPVFEALTNQAHSQKYKLVSVSNPRITYMPRLVISTTGNIVLTRGRSTIADLEIEQRIGDGAGTTTVEQELVDTFFSIELSHMFLSLQNNTPQNVDAYQKATYLISSSGSVAGSGGSKLKLTLVLRSIPDSTWQMYDGGTSSITDIRTYIKISGITSGAVLDVPITIKAS
jgi:hypothetical protein